MAHLTTADFETRYRRESDPWGYTTSAYERDKYRATLDACGWPAVGERWNSALELGSSIGVFSALLAPRCRSLVTIDAAPTAVDDARRRLGDQPTVTALVGHIPREIPRRTYDLVVASEILYYLEPPDLDMTLDVLCRCTRPGARLVAVHWRPPGPERPFDAAAVHQRLRRAPWLISRHGAGTADYLLDVLERR